MYAGVLANVSILSMFLAVPVGFLVKLVAMNTGLSRKPFDFFLCHYKLESGAIFRLLHMRLAEGNLKALHRLGGSHGLGHALRSRPHER